MELQRMTEDPVSLESPVGDGESSFSDVVEDTNTRRPHDQVAGTEREQLLAMRWPASTTAPATCSRPVSASATANRRRWSRSDQRLA